MDWDKSSTVELICLTGLPAALKMRAASVGKGQDQWGPGDVLQLMNYASHLNAHNRQLASEGAVGAAIEVIKNELSLKKELDRIVAVVRELVATSECNLRYLLEGKELDGAVRAGIEEVKLRKEEAARSNGLDSVIQALEVIGLLEKLKKTMLTNGEFIEKKQCVCAEKIKRVLQLLGAPEETQGGDEQLDRVIHTIQLQSKKKNEIVEYLENLLITHGVHIENTETNSKLEDLVTAVEQHGTIEAQPESIQFKMMTSYRTKEKILTGKLHDTETQNDKLARNLQFYKELSHSLQ